MPVLPFVGVGVPQAAGAVLGKRPTFVKPVGIVATSPVRPTTSALRYVRKTGSDTNGGSSASITPDSQGTDGVTNGTTTFTAATGTFSQADVNKLIMIGTKARYRITAVGSTTSITLSDLPSAGSSLTWKVGGAVLTIAALLSTANSPAGTILGGDTIYIGAGVYREVAPTLPTPTFELVIEGDVTGFWTGDRGMVQVTGYTTDDRTAPSATSMWSFAGKSNFTFNRFVFVGGTGSVLTVSTTSQHLNFNDCAFLTQGGISYTDTIPFGTYRDINFTRCYFGPTGGGLQSVTATSGTGNHYDVGIAYRNCMIVGYASSTVMSLTNSGTAVGKGGGMKVLGCTFVGGSTCIASAASVSIAIPTQVYGCVFFGTNVSLSANAFGQIVEGGNMFYGGTPRQNVGLGAGSVPGATIPGNSYAPLYHFGQEAIWGAMPRQLGEPMVGSPLLGFGWDTGGSDILGRPRPAGEYSTARATSAVGALQRGNTATADATPIGGGTTPIQITGPGFEDFYVPVPARAITVSCSVRFTGSPARLEVLANPTIGVRGQSVVANGLPNVVQTVTLDPFTPTAAGNMVTVRIYNPDPSGTSVLEVDDFLVSG